MRILLASVATETNTFSPMPTGLADFDVIRAVEYTPEKAGEMGEFEALRQCALADGHEFIISLAAFAQPAGLTVRSAYAALRDEALHALKAALPVDIVFLPLHGAMVAQGYEDCEGDFIICVREIVGPATVIGVELDLHCHLTQQMVDQADLIVIYKEYPHIDPGLRAKELYWRLPLSNIFSSSENVTECRASVYIASPSPRAKERSNRRWRSLTAA
jgi:microcystin degradation protein MlrC